MAGLCLVFAPSFAGAAPAACLVGRRRTQFGRLGYNAVRGGFEQTFTAAAPLRDATFRLECRVAPAVTFRASPIQSMARTPDTLPPPYPAIHDEIMAGRVIPFLGAGAPLYARNPTTTPWMQRQKGQEVIGHLPTGAELAKYLASRAAVPAPERGELTKMAQYYETTLGPGPLRQRLREIFSYEQPPTPLHEFFADVPQPLLIVTTNYDDLMERAYRQRGKPCDVVVHLTDSEKVLWWPHGEATPVEMLADDLDIDLDMVSVVYKMHGAIDRRAKQTGHYVITEDDYIEFLTRMTRRSVVPTIFAEPFQTRPFLFLGYGLYDWNLRVILNRIQEFRGHPKFRSWAIETLSKPLEKALWNARGVTVYDGLTLDAFLTELKQHGQGDDGTGAANSDEVDA